MILLIAFAFLAGFVTVLSPCVLPVLPAILSSSIGWGKWRPLGVVIGLVASFSFFTLALATLVQQFGISADILRYTAILLIGFFGFTMILPYLSDWFAKVTSSVANWGSHIQAGKAARGSGFFSGLILGVALGLVWTPCAGPILAAITTLVATQEVSLKIVLITLAYSLGAGIPLLLIAYGGNKALTSVPFLSKHSEGIRQAFGWIMLLTAIALAFHLDTFLQQKVLDLLPRIEIENTSTVKQELEKLRPPPLAFPTEDVIPRLQQGEDLPKIIQAPDFVGITEWINSPPLTLTELKGKTVLVDFWTYSCINCIRTLPHLIRWYETYKEAGFTIIGVHTPEFEFEKSVKNVKDAVERFKIPYPVAMDNNYKTWTAYHNAYWPAKYLIDRTGMIRYVHFGEGNYLETENAIRSLLGMSLLEQEETASVRRRTTPEIYLGYERAANYVSAVVPDQVSTYTLKPPGDDQVSLGGKWKADKEFITSEGEDSILELNFLANRVYMVLGGQSNLPIQIELDGHPVPEKYFTIDTNNQGDVFVQEERKYDLVNLQGDYGRHRLTLHIPKGIQAYTFTFGSEKE